MESLKSILALVVILCFIVALFTGFTWATERASDCPVAFLVSTPLGLLALAFLLRLQLRKRPTSEEERARLVAARLKPLQGASTLMAAFGFGLLVLGTTRLINSFVARAATTLVGAVILAVGLYAFVAIIRRQRKLPSVKRSPLVQTEKDIQKEILSNTASHGTLEDSRP